MASEYITSPIIADVSTTSHEDLSDTIAMVDPVSFPLYWLLEHKTVSNINYDWLVDNIPYTPGIQASPEGQQASGTRSVANAILAQQFDGWPESNGPRYQRPRLTNTTTILNKVISVSGTQQSSNEAGVPDEYAHQAFRIGTAQMMQQEYNLHWCTYQDGNSNNTPDPYTRRMHGLVPWILSTGLDGSDVVIAGATVPEYYSATVWYLPTWYPMESTTGGTDQLQVLATLTGTGPFQARINGSGTIVSYGATEAIPRIRMFSGAGTTAADDGVHTTAVGVSTTVIDTGTTTNYGDGDDTFVDFAVDLTRNNLHENILQPAYAKGMRIRDSIMLCPMGVKRLISNFAHVYGLGSSGSVAPLNHRHIPAVDKMLSDTIDVYETDTGRIFINLDRYFESGEQYKPLGTNQGFYSTAYSNSKRYYITPNQSFILIEPDMVNIAPFANRGFFHAELGKQGDSIEGMITSEIGLKVLNPRALAGGFGVVAKT